MRQIRIGTELATLWNDCSWESSDPTLERLLNRSTKALLEELGPSRGEPVVVVFDEITREFSGTVLSDEFSSGAPSPRDVQY